MHRQRPLKLPTRQRAPLAMRENPGRQVDIVAARPRRERTGLATTAMNKSIGLSLN